MKKTLLFAFALAVIPVGVDAQVLDLEETRASAEQGNASAQSNLGVMYANGPAGRPDFVLAHMWSNLASAQGSELAQENKNLFEQRMTREEIAEAQRLSREWIEAHPPGGN